MQAVIEDVSEQLQLCYSPLTDSNTRTVVKHKKTKKKHTIYTLEVHGKTAQCEPCLTDVHSRTLACLLHSIFSK